MIWCGATLVNNKFLPLDLIQFEMVKKGFIAVNAGYDSSLIEYANSPGRNHYMKWYLFCTYEECSNVV